MCCFRVPRHEFHNSYALLVYNTSCCAQLRLRVYEDMSEEILESDYLLVLERTHLSPFL